MNGENQLAVFCDFENVALGVRDAKYAKFDISRVLERLLVKGSIVVKKAYCDWDRYKEFKGSMHEASFELIEIPHVRMSGKNSADIRMVVDALDLCYTKEHIDSFVIISGDSDFSPLVSKLRENAKTVIGVGVRNSTSDLLMSNCDEFIFYDDLVAEEDAKRGRARRRAKPKPKDETKETAAAKETVKDAAKETTRDVAKSAPRSEPKTEAKPKDAKPASPADQAQDDRMQEAIDLVIDTAEALYAERGERAKLWGSMIKQTLKRRRPGFNESTYGFDSFSDLLEEAQERGYLELTLDTRSGGYLVLEVTR